METLTREVMAWLKANGANLIGISTVERFGGAPRGEHPRDFLREARSVITFGVALLHQALHWEGHLVDSELVSPEHQKDLLQNYFYWQTGYVMVNNLLDIIRLRTLNFLESQGYLSLFFPATYGTKGICEFIRRRIPSKSGFLSQRYAAVRAGKSTRRELVATGVFSMKVYTTSWRIVKGK